EEKWEKMQETSEQPDNTVRNWSAVVLVGIAINLALLFFDTHLKKEIINAIREAQDLVYKLETLGGVSNGQAATRPATGRTIPASSDPSVRSSNGAPPVVDPLPNVEENEPPNEAGKSRSQFVAPDGG